MTYTNVNRLVETELAGCLDIVRHYSNYKCVRDNLVLRIALYRTRAAAEHIAAQVEEEAEGADIPAYEYAINELQYEYRLAQNKGAEESRLINAWVKKMLADTSLEEALEFISYLKNCRNNRVRRL